MDAHMLTALLATVILALLARSWREPARAALPVRIDAGVHR